MQSDCWLGVQSGTTWSSANDVNAKSRISRSYQFTTWNITWWCSTSSCYHIEIYSFFLFRWSILSKSGDVHRFSIPMGPHGQWSVSHPSTQAPRRSRAAGLGMQARLRKYRGREDSNLHQWKAHEKRAKTNGLNIKYNQQTMYKHGEWENICWVTIWIYLDLFGSLGYPQLGSLGYPQLGFHFPVTCTFENCTSTEGPIEGQIPEKWYHADTKMQWLTSSEEQPSVNGATHVRKKNQELSFQHIV